MSNGARGHHSPTSRALQLSRAVPLSTLHLPYSRLSTKTVLSHLSSTQVHADSTFDYIVRTPLGVMLLLRPPTEGLPITDDRPVTQSEQTISEWLTHVSTTLQTTCIFIHSPAPLAYVARRVSDWRRRCCGRAHCGAPRHCRRRTTGGQSMGCSGRPMGLRLSRSGFAIRLRLSSNGCCS